MPCRNFFTSSIRFSRVISSRSSSITFLRDTCRRDQLPYSRYAYTDHGILRNPVKDRSTPKATTLGVSSSAASARVQGRALRRFVTPWLVRNLRLDKFRQKSERFLPAEIASICGNDIGDTFLHNFYLCSTGYFVQRNRRSHFSGQVWVIELACVTNTFVGREFEICSAERMAMACGEIAERHLIRTTDFRVHMVNLSSESVRRKPPSHSVRVNKRSVDFLGRRAKHTVKLDDVGNHEQFSFRCASVKPVDTGSDM